MKNKHADYIYGKNAVSIQKNWKPLPPLLKKRRGAKSTQCPGSTRLRGNRALGNNPVGNHFNCDAANSQFTKCSKNAST
mgnify:CR=1 FL=1